mmetsp:Transcript_38520/g.80042  ORF Transcript_38520/g.80042 Transcript_38520/m.80042 type:complete len:230 (+) Transcript_38520:2602-3291(+)
MSNTDSVLHTFLVLGILDQRPQNGNQDNNNEPSKKKCHFKILPCHLLSEISGLLLEHGCLFIQLIRFFGQRFSLFGVLQHASNVRLHLRFDNIHLVCQGFGFVNVVQIVVLLACLRQDTLRLAGETVLGSFSSFSTNLLHKRGVQFLQHLNGNTRGISKSGNYSQADTIQISSINNLVLVGLDNLETPNCPLFRETTRRVVGNHSSYSIRVRLIASTVQGRFVSAGSAV